MEEKSKRYHTLEEHKCRCYMIEEELKRYR